MGWHPWTHQVLFSADTKQPHRLTPWSSKFRHLRPGDACLITLGNLFRSIGLRQWLMHSPLQIHALTRLAAILCPNNEQALLTLPALSHRGHAALVTNLLNAMAALPALLSTAHTFCPQPMQVFGRASRVKYSGQGAGFQPASIRVINPSLSLELPPIRKSPRC